MPVQIKKQRRQQNPLRVEAVVATPAGPVPLDYRGGSAFMGYVPAGPGDEARGDKLRYGPLVEAVERFLLARDQLHLRRALAGQIGPEAAVQRVRKLRLAVEKHGCQYHVVRADVSLDRGGPFSLAVNIAPEERGNELRREVRALRRLEREGEDAIPTILTAGVVRYRAPGEPPRRLLMFVCNWFAGLYEFHWHRKSDPDELRLLLWDDIRGYRFLQYSDIKGLYRKASQILTRLYNWRTLHQVYPWHHAAGDFVVGQQEEGLRVSLISVRDYCRVLPFRGRLKAARLLALICFFLQTSIQMRLDRLDGTGPLIWVQEAAVLEGTQAGFLGGLNQKAPADRRPTAANWLQLMQTFDQDEWLRVAVQVLEWYPWAEEELDVIQPNLRQHVREVVELING